VIRSEASHREERSTTILSQRGVGGSPLKREYLEWEKEHTIHIR